MALRELLKYSTSNMPKKDIKRRQQQREQTNTKHQNDLSNGARKFTESKTISGLIPANSLLTGIPCIS
jgi:hypothetical protein